MTRKICYNPAHPQEQPVTATHVVVDRHNRPHFVCDPCSRILDYLGNLDTFIQELAEWEEEQLTPEERRDDTINSFRQDFLADLKELFVQILLICPHGGRGGVGPHQSGWQ